MVKSTRYSCRGPRFDFQHPHGSPQLSVTPVTGDLISSSGFLRHQARTWCIDIRADKASIHVTFLKDKTIQTKAKMISVSLLRIFVRLSKFKN